MKHRDESKLVSRLKQGDPSAFEAIFEAHHWKIQQYALRLLRDESLSDDIVQDTFLHFWLQRSALEDHRSIVPYLYVIARRVIIDHWRKAATSKAFLDRLFHRIQTSDNTTEEEINANELTYITESGLQQLSPQQRAVFMLSREEGLTYQQIADRIQISRDTVKYHLVNALKILREHFQQHGVIYIALFYNLL